MEGIGTGENLCDNLLHCFLSSFFYVSIFYKRLNDHLFRAWWRMMWDLGTLRNHRLIKNRIEVSTMGGSFMTLCIGWS